MTFKTASKSMELLVALLTRVANILRYSLVLLNWSVPHTVMYNQSRFKKQNICWYDSDAKTKTKTKNEMTGATKNSSVELLFHITAGSQSCFYQNHLLSALSSRMSNDRRLSLWTITKRIQLQTAIQFKQTFHNEYIKFLTIYWHTLKSKTKQ